MLSLTADSNDNWVCVVAMPAGVTGYIIWNPNNNSFNYSIPTSWGITQEITLSGATTNMTGVSNVTVGNNPIILEN
jgi:hypothetical protein